MDVEIITNLISTLGFPIFVCLILFWFIKIYLDKFILSLKGFKDAIELNSKSLEKLSDKLEGFKNV